MVEASLTLLDTQQVDDCWNRIGVHGDKSCERLAEHVHCRNCEVYAAAATYLLDRIALRQDQLDSAETMDSQREQSDLGETRSILVFRLGEEWFGLATGSLVEVAPMNPIHSLPHQRSRALQGVTNVRGALVACLSLGELLDLEPGALLDDGSPVLILDVEDLLHSVGKLLSSGRLERIDRSRRQAGGAQRKRILVVDDSLTVRELERKLLLGRGYDVAVAVDGMDGWNALRSEHFDLLITDIDMPRMDGIELVTLVRRDSRLQSLPVMVVSYKDREEDRRRGLDAGADYYLAKASFHDEALLDAVVVLIGEAQG